MTLARRWPGFTTGGLFALLLLAGCPKNPLGPEDLTLPEADTFVVDGDVWTVLDRTASSLQPGTRADALDAAIRGSTEAGGGPWGPRALHDPAPWVQRVAVDALASRLPEQASAELLSELIARDSSSPYVRSHGAVMLREATSSASVAALSASWREERDPWARSALALGAFALGDSEALPAVTSAVQHGNIALEMGFVMDMAAVSSSDLVDAMATAQEVVEPELALTLAAARLQAGDERALRVLRDGLSATDPIERLEALELLVPVRSPAVVELLERALVGGDAESRALASLMIASRQGEGVKSVSRALAADEPEVVRLGLAWAGDVLGPKASKRDLKAVRPAIDHHLLSDVPEHRRAALEAVRELGLSDVDPEPFLADDYAAVRVEAARLVLEKARSAL